MQAISWAGFVLSAPKVMGILNVTPDSFSDGGRSAVTKTAVAAGLEMLRAGADIIDVGGESTRPGAAVVAVKDEIARVVPVIKALAAAGAVVSADTRNAATMAAVLDAGARIINDVSALRHDKDAARVVAAAACPVVLMHMRGQPQDMNAQAQYEDVATEVLGELNAALAAALAAGITPVNIALDPGFGFAKLGAQNLALLRATSRLAGLGQALVIGVSRKKFIGQFGGQEVAVDRLGGSLAAGLYALSQGAHILRVHDVAQTVQAMRLWQELTKPASGSAKG